MLTVDQLESPMHKHLLQLWLSWKGEQVLPQKSQINPAEIGSDALPYIAILEALEGGKDYRYRLVGTALCFAIDQDFTWETVLGFFGSHDELYVLDGYEKVRQSKEPACDPGDFRDKSKEFLTYQRLMLPFGWEGRSDIILACFDFDVKILKGFG